MHRLSLAIIQILCLVIGAPINGSELRYNRARIIEIIPDNGKVYIDDRLAKKGYTARLGSIIVTGPTTRVRLLFEPGSAIGILLPKSVLQLRRNCILIDEGYISNRSSCVGENVIAPLGTTYILDRGCLVRDCLPPQSLPRMAKAFCWVQPVHGRIFIGSRDSLPGLQFIASIDYSPCSPSSSFSVRGKMISTDAGKQLLQVKDFGHESATDLGPVFEDQDFNAETTRGDLRDHSIFTCGQEIVLDRDGNILYVRNLSKEQLNELFQRRPGFR